MKSCPQPPIRTRRTFQPALLLEADQINEPLPPLDEPDDSSDLDDFDLPRTDDDSRWDVFIPDDDERDPLPDRDDFWGSEEPGAWSEESD